MFFFIGIGSEDMSKGKTRPSPVELISHMEDALVRKKYIPHRSICFIVHLCGVSFFCLFVLALISSRIFPIMVALFFGFTLMPNLFIVQGKF